MKITCISDTHGHHRLLTIAETDILIHAGDISGVTKKAGVIDFFEWYTSQPAKYKILVAGNHDRLLIKGRITVPEGIIYLQNSGITVEGKNIWGSPFTLMFAGLFPEKQAEMNELGTQTWNKIPLNTDILITHRPPKGILDLIDNDEPAGCEILFEKVMTVKPILHIFGHIHESYGILKNGHTTFINASNTDSREGFVNGPICIEI